MCEVVVLGGNFDTHGDFGGKNDNNIDVAVVQAVLAAAAATGGCHASKQRVVLPSMMYKSVVV